jgi:hypothetical protein
MRRISLQPATSNESLATGDPVPIPTSILPSKPRVRRKRKQRAETVPVALTLVAAYYDGDVPGIYLTFDRAIDISTAVLSAFVVNDGPDSILFVGSAGPEVVTETQILILMTNVGSYSGPEVLLEVGAGNGIVAVDDGGTWAGVVDLVLPFG